MPVKMVLYFNMYNSGWSETYYHPTDDPKGLATTLPNSFYQGSVSFRSGGCQLKAIRFSKTEGDRQSFLARPYPNAQGTAGTAGDPGPDVASTDAVFLLTGASNTSRRVYMRGMADLDVKRDIFGNDILSASLRNGTNLFFQSLTQQGFAIRKQARPPAEALIWYPAERVTASETNRGQEAAIANVGGWGAIAVGGQVTFNGIPKSLPGFPRTAVVIRKYSEGGFFLIDIKYSVPGGVAQFPSSLKVAQVKNLFGVITGWQFERFSERKTGRPFGSLRGRAR